MNISSTERGRVVAEEFGWYSRTDRLTRTGIARKYWDRGFEGFSDRPATREMYTQVLDYVETFADSRMHDGRGLTLVGPPGLGKTMIASIAGVALSDAGHYVRFIALAEYVSLLIRQITLQKLWQQHPEAHAALEEWAENDLTLGHMESVAHLVILDDVGKEHRTSSGFAEDAFDLFLRRRVHLGRPVLLTSNVKLGEWAGQYSEAMQDFLYEAGDVIQVSKRDSMRRRGTDAAR